MIWDQTLFLAPAALRTSWVKTGFKIERWPWLYLLILLPWSLFSCAESRRLDGEKIEDAKTEQRDKTLTLYFLYRYRGVLYCFCTIKRHKTISLRDPSGLLLHCLVWFIILSSPFDGCILLSYLVGNIVCGCWLLHELFCKLDIMEFYISLTKGIYNAICRLL